MQPRPQIGEFREGSLHRALKEAYRRPEDRVEVGVDDFVVDIVRDGLLVEIQTGSFRSMRHKLDSLLEQHRILVVHPIAVDTILRRPNRPARLSPKHGSALDLFDELVSVPTLLDHPHFSLEVVMCKIARYQVPDPTLRRGRGGYRNVDRRLLEIYDLQRFDQPADLMRMLPDLPDEFTTADLAGGAGIRRRLAQRVAYCLDALGLISAVGRRRDGCLYRMAPV